MTIATIYNSIWVEGGERIGEFFYGTGDNKT